MKNYLIPAAIVLLALIGSLEPVPAADRIAPKPTTAQKKDAEFRLPVIAPEEEVYCADGPNRDTYHVCSIEAGDYLVVVPTHKTKHRWKLKKWPVKYR